MNNIAKTYRAAVITASDKGAAGLREDESGALLKTLLTQKGYRLAHYCILPDDFDALCAEMKRLADHELCDVVFTTGGTGFSPRDVTPEATLAVSHRLAPGISEAIRYYSLGVTKRAMLGRGVSVIRGKTLIVNLPGSPKAVGESFGAVIDEIGHGLAILRGDAGECAR